MKEKLAILILMLLCMFELGQNVDFAAGQLVIDWMDGATAFVKVVLACYVGWKITFPTK